MSILTWTETTILGTGERYSRWERSELEFGRPAEDYFRSLIDRQSGPWNWTPPHAAGRLELTAVPAPSGDRMVASWAVDGGQLVHAAILAGGSPEGDAMILDLLQRTVVDSARKPGDPPAARDLLAEPTRPLVATIVLPPRPDARDPSEPMGLIAELTSLLALAFFRRALGG